MLRRSLRPILTVVAVIAALLVTPVAAQSIVAVVNDAVVTQRDVDQRVRLALLFAGQPATEANAQRLRPQVIRQLVDQRLQMQEAARLGIEVPDVDVDAQVTELAVRNNITLEQLYGILGEVGVAAETLRQQLRIQMAWSAVAQRQLLPRVVVSDVQLAQSLRIANSGEVEYRLGEIFLPVYAPEQEARVLDDALRLREAILGGADFGALAQQVSTSGSAERGGDLGWLPVSALPQELQAVVTSLPDGGISQPVRTPDGVYLFRREGRREGSAGLSVSLRSLRLTEADTVADEPVTAFVERARTEAPSCPALETLVGPIGDVGLTALDDIDPTDLDEPLATAALTQPIGVLSAPLRSPDGILLVMVCSRSGGADEAARQRMVEQLRLEGLERLASRYLRNLRQEAFIDLRSVPG